MIPPNTPRKDKVREPVLWLRDQAELFRRAVDIDSPDAVMFDKAAAEIERLREALESIADHNKVRAWTATSDNPETHWVTSDGFYAVIARQALKEHPRNAD